MTRAEIRLKLIELVRPQNSNPDLAIWMKRAAELEAWITSAPETPDTTEGQAETPPQKRGPRRINKTGDPEFGPAF